MGAAKKLDLTFLELQLRILYGYYLGQHLLFQSRQRDRKINDRDFDTGFRGVRRVAYCRRQKDFESFVIVQNFISETYGHRRTDLFDVLRQDGFQRGVQFLLHVLQQHPLAELNCLFYHPHYIRV